MSPLTPDPNHTFKTHQDIMDYSATTGGGPRACYNCTCLPFHLRLCRVTSILQLALGRSSKQALAQQIHSVAARNPSHVCFSSLDATISSSLRSAGRTLVQLISTKFKCDQ